MWNNLVELNYKYINIKPFKTISESDHFNLEIEAAFRYDLLSDQFKLKSESCLGGLLLQDKRGGNSFTVKHGPHSLL